MATLRTPHIESPRHVPTYHELDAAVAVLDDLWWTIMGLREGDALTEAEQKYATADCDILSAARQVVVAHSHVTCWPQYADGHYRVDPATVEPQSLKAGTPVRVVFDLETALDVPVPIGVYLHDDEDAVTYRTPDGRVTSAPADCVRVVEVEV